MKLKKKIGKRIISLVLSLSMIFSVMLTMVPAMEVKAAGAYSAYMYNLVNFDEKEWYLIEDNSTAANTGTVTLLSKDCVAASVYNSEKPYVDYSQSTVKGVVDDYYSSKISEKAKNAVDGDMFLLTTAQAQKILAEDEEKKVMFCHNEFGGSYEDSDKYVRWWLCSKGSTEDDAAYGYASHPYNSVSVADYGEPVTNIFGVRPALKLKLSAVSFSSQDNTFSLEVPVSSVSISPNNAQTININSTVTFTATGLMMELQKIC
ncbi:MAG: hypothetical protein IJ054_07835 [Lachnospiraceae bacterium]|nr:hypothetical protein [Lachnospiraceae bacterium]